MIKLLLILSVVVNLVALDTNTTKETAPLIVPDTNTTKEVPNLENDVLFHADRESGLSVHDAINHAIEMSPKMSAAYESVVQSNQKVKVAEAGHLPVVNLTGDTGIEVRQYALDDNSPSVSTPITSKSNYKKADLYLTITENLWAGGSIENAVNEKDASAKASLFDYRDKLEALVVETTSAYFDVVYSEIAMKISHKNMKDYEKILHIVNIKEKNGAATTGDVNFIRANVDNAKTELVQKQKALSDAIAQYTYLLQPKSKSDLPYETTTKFYNEDLNTSLENADKFNAKILKQKANIEATAYSFLATKKNFQPKIDLSINGQTKNEYDIGLGKREKVSALITFDYNLYNGNKDEATAVRLLSKMKEQKYLYKDLKRKLAFEIKVLNRSVSSLSQSLQHTQGEVIAARKVVASYWVAFQHGTQDLQALQLAQRNLNRAEQDYAKYKKDLITNNFKLLRKTGNLLQNLSLEFQEDTKDFKAEKLSLYTDYEDLK